jgi:hypothetical protein
LDETPLAFAVLAILSIGCSADGPPAQNESTGADAGIDTTTMADASPTLDTGPDGPADTDPLDRDVGSPGGDAVGRPTPKVWRLGPEATEWKVFADGTALSASAPTSPVRAAFDIEHSNFAFVVTETSLHRLHLDPDRHGDSDPVWTDVIPLKDVDADLGSTTLRAAHADPADSPDDAVTLLGTDDGTPRRWRASYDFDREVFGEWTGESVEWTHQDAPTPREIGFAWRDNDNARGWFDGEPPCGISPTGEFRAYVGYASGETVHMHDVWYCTDYFRAVPMEQAGPSAAEQMPAIEDVGAAFWHGRALYLIEDREEG